MLNDSELNEAGSGRVEAPFGPKDTIQHKFSRSQKISVIFLAFFAFLVITLWLVQFKQGLSLTARQQTAADRPAAHLSAEQNREARLRAQDTDGDGLSDWDELNIYGTSPYLEDTDGDGVSDYDEIMRGTDPLCPEGQVCQPAADADDLAPEVVEGADLGDMDSLNLLFDLMASREADAYGEEAYQEFGLDDGLGEILSNQMDAASLRAILIESGLEKDFLDQISDEELMRTFLEVVKNEE